MEAQTKSAGCGYLSLSGEMEPVSLENFHCIVCKLLEKSFSSFSFVEKQSIISKGRQTPILNLSQSKNTGGKGRPFTRHFSASVYDTNKWLTGCEQLEKVFCWPCLLFQEDEKSMWITTGFSNLNNLHKVMKQHSNSKNHLQAIVKEKTFGSVRIEYALDRQLTISNSSHNELVEKNRGILRRLIDITIFLGEHKLISREHDENTSTNYVDLMNLLSKYDPALKNHLEQSTVFRGISNRIQNDLIKSVADVALNNIKCELANAQFVAVVLNETTDLSQLSVVLRYVNGQTVQERFLGFVTAEKTPEALVEIVCEVVEDLECGSKLIAQSYDGGVAAGDLNKLHVEVKEKFQSAVFVHCFAHRLDLILSQSLAVIKECEVFFSTLSALAGFFSKSKKRSRALDELIQKRFPKVDWKYNGRLVLTVFEYREALIMFFDAVLNQFDAETVNAARGYLALFKKDFIFNYLLIIFSDIFPKTDILSDVLQTKANDVGICNEKINEFEETIRQKREAFEAIYAKTNEFEHFKPEKKRKGIDGLDDPKALHRRLFFEIMDNISEQLQTRFKNFSDLRFLELCNFGNYINSGAFPDDAFNSLKNNYGNLFDTVALRSQLSVLYTIPEMHIAKSCSQVFNFLTETGLYEAYSEVFNLCKLVLTIPAASVSVKRFSVFKRIKNFVKNSREEERFSNLAIISVEKDLIKNLSENPKFYDDVIDEFAKVERRIELYFK